MGVLLASGCSIIGLFEIPETPTPDAQTARSTSTVSPTLTQTIALPEATPTVEYTYKLSEDDQFSILTDLWFTIASEYLYEDFNGLDWDKVYEDYAEKIVGGISDQEFYSLMHEIVLGLGDDHSVFLTPEEVASQTAEYESSFDYVGIGVFVGAVPERDRAVIYLVFPGSPADRVGIRMHDSILLINGESILDEDGYLTDKLLGAEGAPVTLLMQYPGEEPRELALTRARITGAISVPYALYKSPEGKRIGYILLPSFTDGSVGDQVEDALIVMTTDSPLDGLILDNRVNSGGYDVLMTWVLGYFMGGEVGYYVNRSYNQPIWVDEVDVNGSLDVPLVVLIGKGTVSFGEVFSGLLQEEGRAYLIGETTDGNVEILSRFDFDDGSMAWIANAAFVPASNPDVDWEDTGIIPDLEINSAWDQITPEDDPGIDAALEYFDR